MIIDIHTIIENEEDFANFFAVLDMSLENPSGNDDCTEPIFKAISRGLHQWNNVTNMYVLTDAPTKDKYLFNSIIKMAEDKNIKVRYKIEGQEIKLI